MQFGVNISSLQLGVRECIFHSFIHSSLARRVARSSRSCDTHVGPFVFTSVTSVVADWIAECTTAPNFAPPTKRVKVNKRPFTFTISDVIHVYIIFVLRCRIHTVQNWEISDFLGELKALMKASVIGIGVSAWDGCLNIGGRMGGSDSKLNFRKAVVQLTTKTQVGARAGVATLPLHWPLNTALRPLHAQLRVR